MAGLTARRLTIIATICLGAAAGLALSGIVMRSDDGPGLELAVADRVDEPALEGQVIRVNVQLENRSNRQVSIKSYHASCGCTSVTFPFELPHGAPAGSVIPLEATIDTTNQPGHREFRIDVVYGSRRDNRIVSIGIPVVVLPGIRVKPASIVFTEARPGVRESATVSVFDGFSGDGILADQFELSSSKQLDVLAQKVEPAEANRVDTANGTLTERYALQVGYVPVASPDIQSHEIQLTAGSRSIRIPVLCKLAAPIHSLHPSSLVIAARTPNQVEYREVRCINRAGGAWGLEVTSCPAFIDPEIVDHDARTKRIKMSIDMGLARDSGDVELSFTITGHGKREIVRLPVIFE